MCVIVNKKKNIQNTGAQPYVRSPCPKYGHLPVKLKSLFLQVKNSFKKLWIEIEIKACFPTKGLCSGS